MKSLLSALAAVATLGSGAAMADGHVQRLNSGTVLPGHLPFSEIVVVGETLYLSGMIGIEPLTLNVVEGGIGPETRQTMDNIATILQANGYGMENLVQCTVILENISEWPEFNEIYAEYFEAGAFPARAAIGGTELALGAKVELACIGAR